MQYHGTVQVALRPCLGCRKLIEAGSYCSGCQWRKDASYSPDRPRGRAWMRRRNVAMRRAGWMCERCHERLAEEVHHLNDVRDNRIEALLGVCHDCHVELERAKRSPAA